MPIFWFSYVNNAYACINVSKSSLSAKIYETCRMVFLFVLPLMLIAFHYFKMASTLLKSTKSFQDSNSTFIKQTRARARLAYLAITISVFFGVFWFPSVVYEMWFHFANNEQHFMEAREFINTFRHFHYYMSLANSCLNPWIVFIMSSSHRRKLLQPFSCCTEERRSVQSDAGGGVTCNSTHVAGAGVSNTTCVWILAIQIPIHGQWLLFVAIAVKTTFGFSYSVNHVNSIHKYSIWSILAYILSHDETRVPVSSVVLNKHCVRSIWY